MQKDLKEDYKDFTERHYKEILREAKGRYRFAFFGDNGEDPHVLWRHDLDASVHRAVRLAEIEKDCGVCSTYFVRLHSEFYNLLEGAVYDRILRIVRMGHRLGLHFEGEFYGGVAGGTALKRLLLREKGLLEDWFGLKVGAFSFHNPDGGQLLCLGMDSVGEAENLMVNAYGRTMRRRYHYCSDSNGYWRHERLYDVVSNSKHERLHILTHPEWWLQRPMTPKGRIRRAVTGRARTQMEAYLALLQSAGRKDVG
ncbi:MAG: hypothetical protein OXP12_09645 [Thaumarchaeota archaeon]|nr:hypothetical protein [Nitrososphaerota archaeon]MDE0526981.1 hypothetical protein [Nitrososphaerota archaeon]